MAANSVNFQSIIIVLVILHYWTGNLSLMQSILFISIPFCYHVYN